MSLSRSLRIAAASLAPLGLAACASHGAPDGALPSQSAVSSGREIFVSATGDDAGGDGSRARPFRTLQRAADLTEPGDTVSVMNGTYTNPRPGAGAVLDVQRGGREGAWITYRALPGHHPKLEFDGWSGVVVHGGASYVAIRGFEVEGYLKERTLEYCTARATVADPACNGNGVSIDGRKDGAHKPHHLLIAENDVHDCAGGGISAIDADYVTVENNAVHDTSWHTQYATSGISILTPFHLDDGTGYKMFVRGNKVWNNKTLVKWSQIDALSDGNGIIIDTFRGAKNHNGDYPGRTLVTNNVSIGNGGSGIHAYSSAHVDIVNNSAYMNGQIVGYSDIFASGSDDVRIVNNVMFARADGRVNSDSGDTNVVYDYNVYFGGKAPAVVGPHDRIADPLFVDPAGLDLRVRPGSPAIDAGSATLAPSVDFFGAARPRGAAVDVGAFESDGAAPTGGDLFEAEDAAMVGGDASAIHPGYTGTGFFDFFFQTPASLTWTVPRASAGPASLVIRYANASTSARPLRVLVNGAVVAASLPFPPTRDWSDWQTVGVAATLRAGANTVRLEAGAESGANVDSLRVVAP